ncbi:hypothetical protein FFIC_281290 [Fructobacillus ficulneus]|uniref:Uncharacterized protein n=1 Tax=Fructobacillus ficulneus TaxID=157463 RepID=A0A0K8MI48_9LACO|nr:hypothetical protein FFIC_281290 [Fructobacillus ficulneus]
MTYKKVGWPSEYESSTTAQNEANKRWAEKNKEHKNIYHIELIRGHSFVS